jgi:hypothetical protein
MSGGLADIPGFSARAAPFGRPDIQLRFIWERDALAPKTLAMTIAPWRSVI